MFVIKFLFKQPFQLLNSRAGRALIKKMLFYGNKKRFKPHILEYLGNKFRVPDVMSFLFQLDEIFVQESYKFESVNSTPLIIDCGANIGSSIAYYKSQWPLSKIIAFEADPSIANACKENIKYNNWNNISLIEKAVWIHNNGVELAIEGADGGSIFGLTPKAKVPSVRLKDFLADHEIIDFLKIDIEGAEVEVILDIEDELSKIKNLFIEYHSFIGEKQNLHAILEVLTNQNFRYFLRDAQDRKSPLVNKEYKNNNWMDLQLNIHAYKQ